MSRLLSLAAAGAVIFSGFGLPFLLPGVAGLLLGLSVAAAGSLLFWLAEKRTRQALDTDSAWNRTMKADGETLVERSRRD